MSYKGGNLPETTRNKQNNYFSNKTEDKTIPNDSAQLNDTGCFNQEIK
jgi:hypothetical protein